VIQEVDTGVIQEVDWGFYGFFKIRIIMDFLPIVEENGGGGG